jgi:hypothetical protein
VPGYFLFQKLPDGKSEWQDVEGDQYHFAQRLPNAKSVCKNDIVLFYRPSRSDTSDAGCVYAMAKVAAVEIAGRDAVIAELSGYTTFSNPPPLTVLGDPRRNVQHSLQPVKKEWFDRLIQIIGADGI